MSGPPRPRPIEDRIDYRDLNDVPRIGDPEDFESGIWESCAVALFLLGIFALGVLVGVTW